MQKKFGYAPLGAAAGPLKSAIFGANNALLYDTTRNARCLDSSATASLK
jgi:hypothetical protein